MEFGDILKELRVSQNYFQNEVAELSGLTLRTIQSIESNQVKPGLHSIKVIKKALETDLYGIINKPITNPYEFNLTFKITDMNQFLNDLKTLVKNHWKTILLIVLVIWLVSNYTDIKSGIMDAWGGK